MAPMFVEPSIAFLVGGNQNLQNSSHLPTSQDVYSSFWNSFGICSLKKKPRGFMSNVLQESLLKDFSREKEFGLKHYFSVLYFIML